MSSLCLYFQVHQPRRIRNFSFFDIGKKQSYFDEALDKQVLDKVSDLCYLPANEVLLKAIKKHKGKFKCCFSLSGLVIEQLAAQRPDVIASFKALVDTGKVELLGETYYHSLSAFYDTAEFERQLLLHKQIVRKYFGVEPKTFRNTELLYNNDVAPILAKYGYQSVWIEGSEEVIKYNFSNRTYASYGPEQLQLIPRNYPLSDDIAFRYGKDKKGLNAEKYVRKLLRYKLEENSLHIGMDYETFGEHHSADDGILYFLKNWIDATLATKSISFATSVELLKKKPPIKRLNLPEISSWADSEKNISAWVQNDMQKECIEKLYSLGNIILKLKNRSLLETWSALQCSDHFYYMSTKQHADGDVHNYFSHFDSPHSAYIAYSNILTDLELTVNALRIYQAG